MEDHNTAQLTERDFKRLAGLTLRESNQYRQAAWASGKERGRYAQLSREYAKITAKLVAAAEGIAAAKERYRREVRK